MKIEPRIEEVISLTTSRYFYHCLLDWMDYDENNKLNYYKAKEDSGHLGYLARDTDFP